MLMIFSAVWVFMTLAFRVDAACSAANGEFS